VLEAWAWRRKTAQALALRSPIILACADGESNEFVAGELGVSQSTVPDLALGITQAG
jgi:DNA-binding NarL/FixJ family response regulator